jgi:hypothetical protein
MKEEIQKWIDKYACIDAKIVILIVLLSFLLFMGIFYTYKEEKKEEGEDCQCGN